MTKALTITNTWQNYTGVANASILLAPYMQLAGSIGNVSFFLYGTSFGNITGTDNCTGVKAFYGPAIIIGTRPTTALNITGAQTSVNTCLNQLAYTSYPTIPTSEIDSIRVVATDSIGNSFSSGRPTNFITIVIPPQVGPCDLGIITNGAQVPFTLVKCPIQDVFNSVIVDSQSTNGFFAKVNSPTIPLSNFTVTDTNNNLIIFNHAGNNQAPKIEIEGCYQTFCSEWTNVTCTFLPDTSAPTVNSTANPTISSGDGTTGIIAGAVVAAAVGTSVIIVPLGIRYVNSVSRGSFPIANYLYDHYELDTSNFWSGNGQVFKNVIQDIIRRLNISNHILTDEDKKEIFCTDCLIPAIDTNVIFLVNGAVYGYVFGKHSLDLELFSNEDTINKIVSSAKKLKRINMPEPEEQIADQTLMSMMGDQFQLYNDENHFSETPDGIAFDNAIKGMFILLKGMKDFYMPGNDETRKEFIKKCLLPALQDLNNSLGNQYNNIFEPLQDQFNINMLAFNVYKYFKTNDLEQQTSCKLLLGNESHEMIELDHLHKQYDDPADLKMKQSNFSNNHRTLTTNRTRSIIQRDAKNFESV